MKGLDWAWYRRNDRGPSAGGDSWTLSAEGIESLQTEIEIFCRLAHIKVDLIDRLPFMIKERYRIQLAILYSPSWPALVLRYCTPSCSDRTDEAWYTRQLLRWLWYKPPPLTPDKITMEHRKRYRYWMQRTAAKYGLQDARQLRRSTMTIWDVTLCEKGFGPLWGNMLSVYCHTRIGDDEFDMYRLRLEPFSGPCSLAPWESPRPEEAEFLLAWHGPWAIQRPGDESLKL